MALLSNIYLVFALLILMNNAQSSSFHKLPARDRKSQLLTKTTLTTTTTTVTTSNPIKPVGTDTRIYHSSKTNDKCECGAFKSTKRSSETPLYYQTAMQNFHCDENVCKEMCLNLPAFNDDRGLEILCAHVNQAHGLRPAVHYKNCNNNWLYAGQSPKNAICCDSGKVISC